MINRSSLRRSTFGVGLVLLALTLVETPARAQSQTPAKSADPIPIHRVLLPPERLANELERARQGVLIPLPREEFEKKVRQAAEAATISQNPPQLIEAQYQAVLDGTTLKGAGRWKVYNPTPGAAVLPVQPLGIAVSKVQVHGLVGTPADGLLGMADGKDVGLLLERRGEQAVTLDWSVRGDARPGSILIDLRVPAAPVAVLELTLPIDRLVAPSTEGCRVSGPFPAAAGDRRLWRIDFPGRSQVGLVLRHMPAIESPPFTLARLTSRREFHADAALAEFAFDLDVAMPGTREFRFQCDPGLRPYEVTVPALEHWETGASTGSAALVVRLRDPLTQGQIVVRCIEPIGREQPWTCGTVQLEGAPAASESLVLRVPPELRLENWTPGGFHFSQAGTDPLGAQILTLEGQGIGEGQRPRAIVRTQAPEVGIRQHLAWEITPSASWVTTQVAYEVIRGRLFRLAIRIPPGWEVERVEATPHELLRNWSLVPDPGQPQVVAELAQAIGPTAGPESAPQLTVRLRQDHPKGPPFGPLPFPQVIPLSGRLREETLAIKVASNYQAELVAPASEAAAETGSPGQNAADFVLSSRGQPLTGLLTLSPRQNRVRALCISEVILIPGRARVVCRLTLQPSHATSVAFDLHSSVPMPPGVDWKVKRGKNSIKELRALKADEIARSLGLAAAGLPPEAIAIRPAPALVGQAYRLVLAQPLREPLILEAAWDLSQPSPAGGVWQVPIWRVLGAEPMLGEVSVHLSGSEVVQAVTAGMRETPPKPRAPEPTPWKSFRYGPGPGTLTLLGRTPAAIRPSEAVAESARLTSWVNTDGRLIHHYWVRTRHWNQPTLPLRLPPGALLLSAKVNGSWADHLKISQGSNNAVVVDVPVPARDEVCELDVTYETVGQIGRWWARLDPPGGLGTESSPNQMTWRPELPVRLTAYRHIWRLPGGCRPLFEGRFSRRPGSTEPPSNWTDQLTRTSPQERLTSQAQVNAEANRLLREQLRIGRPITLGAFLERLVGERTEPSSLVVDAAALSDESYSPQSDLSERLSTKVPNAEPFESLGLIVLPCRGGPLVTSRHQADGWRVGGESLPGKRVDDAVQAAAMKGHDSSGRFLDLAAWLEADDAGHPACTSWPPRHLAFQWSEWEADMGAIEGPLVLIRDRAVQSASLFLVFLLCIGAIVLRTFSFKVRLGFLASWIAGSGLGVLWLPSSLRPMAEATALTGLAIALAWYAWSLARKSPIPRPTVLLPLGLIFAWFGTGGRGQDLPPATVYLVPAKVGLPDAQTVLAPATLMERLEGLAHRSTGGAFLAAARYQGKVAGSGADFQAEFDVYNRGDDPVRVVIPLGGVQLREATSDGSAAHPIAVREPREGYALDVKGRGNHRLVLRFTVPVRSVGDDREVRFRVPALPQSRLALDVSGASLFHQVIGCLGGQQILPGAANGGPRLEADLGPAGTLHVRWRPGGEAITPPVAFVREAYLWEIRAGSGRLQGLLQYSVAAGTATAFHLDLPEALEVRGVEVVRLPGAFAEGSGPRLANWTVLGSGAHRQLRLEFQRPWRGGVQVLLELVQRKPLGPTVALAVPVPTDARAAEGPSGESFLAYHMEGRRSQVAEHLRITGIDRQVFADFWQGAGMKDPGKSTHAYGFRRSAAGPPVLRLALEPHTAHVEGVLDVGWQVGRLQAEVRARARVRAPDNNLVVLEWDVPEAVVVTTVEGPEVRSWSRNGERVQVWLRRAVAAAEITVTGWAPTGTSFSLFPLRLVSAPSATTYIRVSPRTGFTLKTKDVSNLGPLPDSSTTGRDMAYLAEGGEYRASFGLLPTPTRFAVQSLTWVELNREAARFKSLVDVTVRQGEVQQLTLRMRKWDGEPVAIEGTGIIVHAERRPEPGVREWHLALTSRASGHIRIRLEGSSMAAGSEVFVPDIWAVGTDEQIRWVGLAGAGLIAKEARGLDPLADRKDLHAAWPKEEVEVSQVRTWWRVREANWQLGVGLIGSFPDSAAVRVVLAEHEVAILDGRRWAHQLTYWLLHATGTDLSIRLPDRAEVLAVILDHDELTPLQPDQLRLWLPIVGPAGSRKLVLQWLEPERPGRLTQPDLTLPIFEGVNEFPCLWTVQVPPALEVSPREESENNLGPGDHDLRRAEAQLVISQALAPRSQGGGENGLLGQLEIAQINFFKFCRFASYRLGPGEKLQAALIELKDRNRQAAQGAGYETIRSKAESRVAPPTSPNGRTSDIGGEPRTIPFSVGKPVFRQTEPGAPPPQIALNPARNRQGDRAIISTFLLLATLLAVGAMALVPNVRAHAQVFWPEQLLAAGVVGWLILGPGWVTATLALVGLAARLKYSIQWIGRAHQARNQIVSAMRGPG